MNGLGEMTFPSNKKYFGFFNEGMRNGFGILFSYEKKKFIQDFGMKINKMVLENLLIMKNAFMENGKKEK